MKEIQREHFLDLRPKEGASTLEMSSRQLNPHAKLCQRRYFQFFSLGLLSLNRFLLLEQSEIAGSITER